MKKNMFLYSVLVMAAIALNSCTKPSFEDDGPLPNPNKPVVNTNQGVDTIKIGYSASQGTLKSGLSGTLSNGQTLSFSDKGWQTMFWLTPDTTVKGSWTITLGGVLKVSKGTSNTVVYNFPDTGSYAMTVAGTYKGNAFSISVTAKIGTKGTTPTITNGPIRWLGTTLSGTNWNISLRCSKTAGFGQNTAFARYTWTGDYPLFPNWSTHNALVLSGDSLDILIALPNTFSGYYSFTYIGEDGSANGVFATAIGDFFDASYGKNVFRFSLDGTTGTITLANAKKLIPGGIVTPISTPGLEGANDFRLTPNAISQTIDIYYKYTGVETVYYRYCNDSVSWTTPTVTAKYAGNNQWTTGSVPMANVGPRKLYIQYGTNNGAFVPFTTIDSPGYWDRKWLKLQY